MITQPFLFQLFAAEEPLTGRLQEITPQVHSWKCVYRKRWQILLWLKHCWIYTSTHCRMSSSPSIDEHKRMDLMASHLQAQINKTTSPQPPPLSALKTPQGLELWTLLKVKKQRSSPKQNHMTHRFCNSYLLQQKRGQDKCSHLE